MDINLFFVFLTGLFVGGSVGAILSNKISPTRFNKKLVLNSAYKEDFEGKSTQTETPLKTLHQLAQDRIKEKQSEFEQYKEFASKHTREVFDSHFEEYLRMLILRSEVDFSENDKLEVDEGNLVVWALKQIQTQHRDLYEQNVYYKTVSINIFKIIKKKMVEYGFLREDRGYDGKYWIMEKNK